MPKNSRAKGKVGELELVALLREHGFAARRGQQYRGGSDSPDVVCPDLPGVHFECKRVEALRIYDAMEQAVREAGDGQIPVVAHRRNRHPWLVVMRAEDFFRLVRESDLPAGGEVRAEEGSPDA